VFGFTVGCDQAVKLGEVPSRAEGQELPRDIADLPIYRASPERASLLHRAVAIEMTRVRVLILLFASIGAALLGLGFGLRRGSDARAAGQIAARPAAPRDHSARLLFAGDVMLGRGVARIAAADPDGLFAPIRFQLSSPDLAVANLESPLTLRKHDPSFGPNALEARPTAARLLAAAGFDALSLANNHAGDAGPGTVSDTVRALEANGIVPVGAGASSAEAYRARIVAVNGLRVALLAFDASRQGPRAGAGEPGVAWWDESLACEAVKKARSEADLVAVGIHGGAEYVPLTDLYLMRIGTLLARWGADIVWGQGPHVVQPVHLIDPDKDGRPTLVATSLGNFVFDQHVPGTRRGAIVEVLADPTGLVAYRIGTTTHEQGPVEFRGWRPPRSDAAALDGAWWTLARPIAPVAEKRPRDLSAFERRKGDVTDAVLGDPDGDGRTDLVVAFRRPFAPTRVGALVSRRQLEDRQGRSAHLGLYRPDNLRPRWVAGTLLRPVARLAACDGALAVAYSTLDNPRIVAAGAWRWGGFGFASLPDLPGPGIPACADVDHDGRLDPLVLERSST
jgi:poly-gamma-glutamate capsule biosynthesis protein CapA/YwtB (metallophosphatase superfamily)